MPPLLHDLSVLHHQDQVGAADGGQPVGDDEAGLILHQRPHGLLNEGFCADVHVGGGFVQDQQVGGLQHGSGNGHQLLLPLGNVHAVFGQQGVVALGQPLDHAVNVGGLGRFNHLLPGRTGVSVGDVVVNRAVEQPRVLQHHRERAPQAGTGHMMDGLAVDGDRPGLGVIEAHEQVHQRSLARAGGADDGDHAARSGGQVHVPQNEPVRVVAEVQVLDVHLALPHVQRLRPRQVGGLLRLVHQLEDPLRRGQRRLQLAENIGRFIDGAGKFAGIQHEGGNIAQRDPAGQVHQRAEKADERQGKIVDEIHRRTGNAGVVLRPVVAFHGGFVLFIETIQHVRLPVIGPDGLLAGNIFLHKAVHFAQALGTVVIQRPYPPGHEPGEQHGKRHRDRKHQHQ